VKAIDLFSGIGGFSLGLERAGIETACFCEVSPVCRHLLAHHWPETPIYDDVTTLTGQRLVADGTAADVLCGGFPCQDLSYAGKGAGLAGERSGLWFHIARLLRELRDLGRPVRIVILENVSALLGRGLGTVLGDLAALGYDAEWDCIPASAVGAPHRRDRIWIVAYARGEQHEGFGDAFRRALASELSRALADAGLRLRDDEEADALGSDAHGTRSHRAEVYQLGGPELRDEQDGLSGSVGDNVADAARQLRNGSGSGAEQDGRTEPSDGGEALAHPHQHDGEGLVSGVPDQEEWRGSFGRPAGSRRDGYGWWTVEPDVGRVAHGISRRVDRLHGLGNAVVPQIPEAIGRAIMTALEPAQRRGSWATMRQTDRDISREAIPIPSSRGETVDG
jgi:DNA (cytosine-5)-methyltransferase 1